MSNEDYQHQLYVISFNSEKDIFSSCTLFAVVLGLALLVLKVLPMMKKNRHIVHPVNPKTKLLLFSAMLQCWVWFVILYVYQFLGLHEFQNIITTKSIVVSTAYMPFVDIGYFVFVIMGVFYLVEFPFLLWCISTKVMAMDRRGLNRRQCMLKSVGCAGMVLFMQVLPDCVLCVSFCILFHISLVYSST